MKPFHLGLDLDERPLELAFLLPGKDAKAKLVFWPVS
jgi:hypothetical protein